MKSVNLKFMNPSNGTSFSHQFDTNTTIESAKQQLLTEHASDVAPARQFSELQLIYNGRFIGNDSTLKAANLNEDDLTLHVVVRELPTASGGSGGSPSAQSKGCCVIM